MEPQGLCIEHLCFRCYWIWLLIVLAEIKGLFLYVLLLRACWSISIKTEAETQGKLCYMDCFLSVACCFMTWGHPVASYNEEIKYRQVGIKITSLVFMKVKCNLSYRHWLLCPSSAWVFYKSEKVWSLVQQIRKHLSPTHVLPFHGAQDEAQFLYSIWLFYYHKENASM